MEADYILKFKGSGRGELALYSVRKSSRVRRMLVKVVGEPARIGHEELMKLSGGGIMLLKSENEYQEYAVRPDLAPIIGSFILLLRRSRNPFRWCKIFSEVVRGRLTVLGEVFTMFFDIAMLTSAGLKKTSGRIAGGAAVPPKVADAVSASLKSFILSIEKHGGGGERETH